MKPKKKLLLALNKETVSNLNSKELLAINAGAAAPTQVHTVCQSYCESCVSQCETNCIGNCPSHFLLCTEICFITITI